MNSWVACIFFSKVGFVSELDIVLKKKIQELEMFMNMWRLRVGIIMFFFPYCFLGFHIIASLPICATLNMVVIVLLSNFFFLKKQQFLWKLKKMIVMRSFYFYHFSTTSAQTQLMLLGRRTRLNQPFYIFKWSIALSKAFNFIFYPNSFHLVTLS